MKASYHKLHLLIPYMVFCAVTVSVSEETEPPEQGTMCRIRRGPAINPVDNRITYSDIAREGINHVVNISTVRLVKRSPLYDNPELRRFFGPDFNSPVPPEQFENSLGSGVYISEDGYVVTNNHVVENAGIIKVTSSGQREYDAEIVGTDPGTDLAVIRLKGDFDYLIPVAFGDSDSILVGDMVMAIGNPFSLSRSVSLGIISGLARANFGVVEYENFIQTDAAINPGNSGGALINMRGELIGINSAILSSSGGYQGIGLSIPSNMVLEVVEQILKNGRVIRGSLGVMVQRVDQDMIDAFNLPGENGVVVTEVTPGSPAERAGLNREDVIIKLDDAEIVRWNQFRNFIAFSPPGANVRMTVLRGGKEISLNATLDELKLPKKAVFRDADWKPRPGGLSVAALSADARARMRIPSEISGHVVVVQVEPGTAAELAGFNPGDIVLELNHEEVTSLDRFTKVYNDAKGNLIFLIRRPEGVLFRYLRNE